MCAAEQIGIHSFGDYDKDAMDASNEDKQLVLEYFRQRMKSTSWPMTSEEVKFMATFEESMKNNLTINRTRDCQMMETGHHYARLAYRTELTPGNIYGIKFSVRFRQNIGQLPKGPPEIYIQEYMERTEDDFTVGTHSIKRDGVNWVRDSVSSKTVSISNDIIKN